MLPKPDVSTASQIDVEAQVSHFKSASGSWNPVFFEKLDFADSDLHAVSIVPIIVVVRRQCRAPFDDSNVISRAQELRRWLFHDRP